MSSATEPQRVVESGVTTGARAEPGAGRAVPSMETQLWSNRNFNIFWAGQSFDALGDAAALILMPLMVLEATGSVAQMGLVSAAMGAGSFVSSIVTGLIVDRADRRKILINCDIGRAFLYAIIPAMWLLIGVRMWPIYLIVPATGFLSTFFFVAYGSVIPSLVEKNQIVAANGRLQATVALAYVAGPTVAGFAAKWLGSANAILVVAASYGLSTVLMMLVRLRKTAQPSGPEEADTSAQLKDRLLVGVRFLLRHPVLKPVSLLLAALFLVSGATVNLTVYRLKHDLYQNDGIVGIVFGAASMGSILAGALASRLHRKKGFGFTFLGAFVLMGAAISLIGYAAGIVLISLLAVCFSFGNTLKNVSSISLRQQVTPDYILGRVSAAWWSFLTVLAPLGTAIATGVAARTSASSVLVAMGIICMLIGGLGLFTKANTWKPEAQLASHQE